MSETETKSLISGGNDTTDGEIKNPGFSKILNSLDQNLKKNWILEWNSKKRLNAE